MALWKKLWLLFAVIWGVVAALQVVSILVFAEEVEREKALMPLLLGVAVPAVAYLLIWLWVRWKAGTR
jgi:hypothetical protein